MAGIRKITISIDGSEEFPNSALQEIYTGLLEGSHTLTAKAYNASNTLVSEVTRNFTVSSLYETETTDFMTATSTPDDANSSIYAGLTNTNCWDLLDSVIKYFKANNAWSEIIHWHPMFGGSAAKHAYNAKDVNAFQMSFFGSWVFSASGNQGNGTNTYGSLGFNPSVNSVVTNAGFSIVYLSNTDSAGTLGCGDIGSNNYYMQPNSGGNFRARIGDLSPAAVSQTTSIGIYTASRNSAILKSYKNKIEIQSTSVSGGLPNLDFYYGARGGTSTGTYDDRLQGSLINHTGINPVIIQEGLRMWEEGLGRLTI